MDTTRIHHIIRLHDKIEEVLSFAVSEDFARRETTKTDEKTKAKTVVKEADPIRFHVQAGKPCGYRVSHDLTEEEAHRLCAELQDRYSRDALENLDTVTRQRIVEALR